MPASAHSCDITAPSFFAASTNRIRSSMTQVSFHGIGRPSCRALKTCQPCIRSKLSAIYPVRTLTQPLPQGGEEHERVHESRGLKMTRRRCPARPLNFVKRKLYVGI